MFRRQVLPVPQGYLYAHHHLLNEFQNATVWPKHLLVEYSWSTPQSVDALSALYFIFFVCAALPLVCQWCGDKLLLICNPFAWENSLTYSCFLTPANNGALECAGLMYACLVIWFCKKHLKDLCGPWSGLVAFMGMALSVLVAYETKLKAFMAEIAGEDPLSVAPLVKGD